jgi:hypothetical protein
MKLSKKLVFFIDSSIVILGGFKENVKINENTSTRMFGN